MPLEQEVLQQGDVLAAQRNPGFETEGLPSPAGFPVPDASIAPIPIPGTGVTEGNGQKNYLDQFNQSILGAKGNGLTPGNLPTYSVSDVYNPRYTSTLPGEDSEEAFGKAQPWYKKWGNALVKFGANTAGTFANSMMTIPETIQSINGEAPYQSSMGDSIDTWLKNLEDVFPNYYTKWQQDHPFMSMVPFSGGFANFWGDKFLKNLGFTVGAIGSAVVTDLAVGAVTEGLGEIPLIAGQIGKASLWLNKVFTGTNRAEQLLALGRNAGRTSEQLFDLQQLAQAAAATKVTNGARYALNLYGSTAAEAGFEARDAYNTVRGDLIKAYQRDNGYSPTGKELEEIDNYARAAGNVRFGANMALIGISNAIQFDAILKPFSVAKTGVRSTIEREIAENASIKLTQGSIDTFERAAPKGIWSKIRPVVPSILTEGVYEEGGQFAAQAAVENYYERKYLYDKKLSKSQYKKDETPWDARDQVNNVVHSIVRGLSDEFGTDEGLENVILGAITGAAFGGVKRFVDREKNAKTLATTLSLLNGQGVTGIMQNHYTEAANSQRIAEDMQEAVRNNDAFRYKNLQHEQFVNFVISGLKAGRFDVRMEQLELLRNMDNEEFKRAFGLDRTTENVKTVGEYVDTLKQKAQKIKQSYDAINDTFVNPFKYRGRAIEKDQVLENQKHITFEMWKDELSLLASIPIEVDQRIQSISREVQQVNPNLDQYHLANFTDRKYLKSYAENLEREAKGLQSLLDQKVSGDPEADRKRIKVLESRVGLINMALANPNLSPKAFENIFGNLLEFHLNGQQEDGINKIPQEVLPRLVEYGRDVNRLRIHREKMYELFEKLSSEEGFNRYFREAEIAEEKQAEKNERRPPENPQSGDDGGSTPPEPVQPKLVITGPEGKTREFDANNPTTYVKIGTDPKSNPEKVTIVGQTEDGITVINEDGTTVNVPADNFFEEDTEFNEVVKSQVNENTSTDDVIPTSQMEGTKVGDMKKDLSFGLFSTTDPVYTRQDIPFNNFHRRHQNFLFDLGSSDPDIFNQDNKPKLRIIPVTQVTAQALGLPTEFARNTDGDSADKATIRGVYIIDDTIDPVARKRQRDKIAREVQRSTTIPDTIKNMFKDDSETAIQNWYEQLNSGDITEQETRNSLGERIADLIIDYASQGLFYADSKGDKLGRVGAPADPNKLIFTTLASTDLTFEAAPGRTEERYTNKENIDPQAAQAWWREQRESILQGTTAEDAMQRTWQFAVSRGIPYVINTGSRNSIVDAGLIRQSDLDKPIITVPTLGNVAILGAYNADGEGITASKSGVNMPLGQPLLNYGGHLVFLKARTFTPKEANNIFELLKILADRTTAENKAPIFKYLHKIMYMANPERGIAPSASSITIDGPNLYIGKNTNPIPMVPAALETNKEQIVSFLQTAYHGIKNSEILRIQRDPKANDLEFVELIAQDGRIISTNRWKNYNYYLLSARDPEGNSREDIPFTTNIAIPQAGERPLVQKYSEILDFDFDYSKFKMPETVASTNPTVPQGSPQTSITDAKSAVQRVIADAKIKGGLTLSNLDDLSRDYILNPTLSEEEKEYVIGAVKLLRDKVEKKNTQQAAEQAKVQSTPAEDSQTAPEIAVTPVPTSQDNIMYSEIAGKKFGYQVTSTDSEGNILDILPIGTIQDDGSITPYKNPDAVKAIILAAIRRSQNKQDTTNNEEKKDLRDKFKGRDFRRGTDRYRMFHPGNSNYKKADLDKEFAEVKDILPDHFTFEITNELIKTTGGGLAWGALQDNLIYIYRNAEVGTTYHEAFEAVWYHFLTGKQQDDLYNEFTSRKGTFTTFEGKTKNLSEASLKEAKEQLAEEFREYKMTGRPPVQTKQRSFFKRLLDFIKWLLGMEISDRNRLFKKMNKGYYRNFSTSLRGPMSQPEYSYYREPGLENYSETVVQDILQGMTAELFGEIFGENSAIVDQLEENFEIAARGIYDKLKQKLTYYFEDELSDVGTLFSEFGYEISNAQKDEDVDALIQQMESIRNIWEGVKGNWEPFVSEHKRFLRVFNVDFYIDDEGDIDFAEEEGGEDSNKSQSEYDRDIFQYDAKNNASNRVKLLIASIADSEWVKEATNAGMTAANSVRSKRESSTMRLPKLVQYAKLFNYLLHNTAGINGIYDIWTKLTSMTEDVATRKLVDANVRKLMSRLKFDGGFENKTLSDAKMILSLENTLVKQKPSFFRQFVDYRMDTYFKTTVLNSKIDQVKATWIASIKGSAVIVPSAENRFMFSKAVIGINDNIEFLNRLGIDITRADFRRLRGANIAKFNDAVNKIRTMVEKAAREKATIPIVSSKQLDFDSRLNDLSELYVTNMVGEDTQSQHPNLENEPTSNFVLNNFVSTMVNDANNALDREDFLTRENNEYFDDIFHRDSLLLNKIIFDSEGERVKHIEVGVVEGRETWDRNNKSTSKLVEAERQLYEINNNLNGVFYTLLPADAKTEWALNLGTYLSVDGFFGDDSSRSNEVTTFSNQMYTWLQTEIELARDFENRKYIDALNRKIKGTNRTVGQSLRFFRDILPADVVNDIHSRVIDGTTPLGDVVSQQQMRAYMREFAVDKANRAKENMIRWNLISPSSSGEYKLYGFDKVFLDRVFGKKSYHTEAELDRLLLFREMNYILNNIEMHKFFFGDPAQYKDELKRIKSFLSGRENTHVDYLGTSEGFNQWANTNLNKAGDIMLALGDPGYQSFKNHFNTLTVYDIVFESNSIDELKEVLGERADPYSEGNEDDAGAYMMNTAYREMMYKAGGRFTGAQERQFQWELAWERNDKAKEGKYTYSSDDLKRHDEELLKKEPDTEVAFPILKLVHSGIQTLEGKAIVSLDKASWAPLFYRWYKGKGLGKLYDQMQKRGIDYIRMESAHKVGIQKPSSLTLYNEEGDVNSTAFDTIVPERIPIKQMGIQVEQTKKEKGQTEGSQLRKIAIGDLMENGVPIDFGSKYRTKEEAFTAWSQFETEAQKVNASRIYAKIRRHDQALINLTTTRTILTMRRLGMELGEDGSVTVPDKKMISDFILTELERRELPRNIASSIQISPETRDFTNPIEANPQYGKIRSIIYSILEKTITRPKVNGGQKTLLAVTGMENGPRVIKRMVNGKPVYTSDVLKFYKRGDNGTEACEVMLPYWFGKKLMAAGSGRTKEEVIEYLNNTKEGQKLLRGIGFRIPTQGLNSVDFFIVKDFLPEQMGDVVILPSEITVKAGSDFDIDKLNVYLRNYYIDAEKGLPRILDYKGSEKATKTYIGELIQNRSIAAGEWRKELEEYIAGETEGFEDTGFFEQITGASELFSNERLIEDFLANRQDDLIDMYYQKTLENEYFDSIEDLVSLPENYARLVAPNDASELKGYRTKLLGLKASSATPLGDYGKLLDSTYMMQERQAYMSSKQVVGISAVSQTAHAIAQNLQGALLVNDSSVAARFPANTVNGKISLSGLTIAGSDNLISNINSQTTDGGVDVAKDKFLAEMGINQDTLSTFLTLVRMGAKPWWAIVYLNQPSIQNFLKTKAISQSVSQINPKIKAKPDWQLLDDTIKNIGAPPRKKGEMLNYPNEYTISEMEQMISKYANNPESLTQEERILQVMILNDFSRYNRGERRYEGYNALAWDLFKFYQGYNWDTARVNDPNLVRLKQLKYDRATNLMVSSVQKVMRDTFIGAMRDSVLQLDEGLRSIINVQHGTAGNLLDMIAEDVFRMRGSEAVKQSLLMNAEMSMVDYSVQNNALIDGRPLNTMISSLLLSNRSTAQYLEALRRHPDKRIYENPFLKAVIPIIDKRKGYPSAIQLLERDFETYTSNVLTDSFRELKDDNTVISISDNPEDDRTVSQIYKRLVLTAMIQSGARSGRGGFSHLIPSETYTEYVRDALRNMQLGGFYENLVLYRTNWNNTTLVPFAAKEFRKVDIGGVLMDEGEVDPLAQPIYQFFVNPRVASALGKILNLPAEGTPMMITQEAWRYRNARVIKIEEYTRDEKTNQIIDKKVRLFRRVDVFGKDGVVPLQYEKNRVIFVEINPWGSENIREFYNGQNQSVLPSNNKVTEADDDTILYALYAAGIETNASEYAIVDIVNKFEPSQGNEEDSAGNQEPSIDSSQGGSRLPREYTPDNITTLPENGVFVFGSNTQGRHGMGAAKFAADNFGAIQGQAEGLQGRSYAIVTKDLTKPTGQQNRSVSLEDIQGGINRLLEFAKSNPNRRFYVTKLGSSLAGYTIEEIRNLFRNANNTISIPDNIVLPREYEVRDNNIFLQVDSFEQFKNQLQRKNCK